MLNKAQHRRIMGQILKDIFSDIFLAPIMGFKGGTCAAFFYDLSRPSVDLDFDLFKVDEGTQKIVFEKILKIAQNYGKIKNSYIKYHTIFILLSYGEKDHNIKIETNTRLDPANSKDYFVPKEYLGITILVPVKDYMFANKLVALTTRLRVVNRDIYDIWYFAKSNWDIDVEIIKHKTGKDLSSYLNDCIQVIEKVKDNEILQGLGELLDEKEKIWVKSHLRKEAIFQLKNYLAALK